MSQTDDPVSTAPDPGALRPVKAPAQQAMLFICRRCERRADSRDAGKRLARRVRKLSKTQFGKGAVRTVFTSCMSLCPRNALTVAVVPGRKGTAQPRLFIADADHPRDAARALMALLEKPAVRA